MDVILYGTDPIYSFHGVHAGKRVQVDQDSHHLPVRFLHLHLDLNMNSGVWHLWTPVWALF